MKLDVSKIIVESLDEIPDKKTEVIAESIEGSMQAAKRSAKAFSDIFRGGSSQDEAEAAKQYSQEAAVKLGEGQPESIVAKEYLKQVGKSAREASDTLDTKEKMAASADEAKEKVASIGKKAVNTLKEHSGVAAAVAAALAAGAGALALRKKMKKKTK